LKGLKTLTNTEFGKYIAKLREKAGYETQAALGKAAGVESSTLSRIETGDTKNPNIETLKKLAPLLGVPIEEIMEKLGYIMARTEKGFIEPGDNGLLNFYFNPNNDADIKLLDRIKKLSQTSKAAVLALVDNLEKIDAQLAKEPEKEA
jgi:transcriptional regulator with XRE-family HTH domain